jgi:predicted RNase H-like HicB family nuclease
MEDVRHIRWLEHRGYRGYLKFTVGKYCGEIDGVKQLFFDGKSEEEAEKNFKLAVDKYIEVSSND